MLANLVIRVCRVMMHFLVLRLVEFLKDSREFFTFPNRPRNNEK
jgi:hypothetical protein